MDEDLQKIQDHYVEQGFSGDRLRTALESDKTYQRLLKRRMNSLKSVLSVSDEEASRYVLSTDKDYEILDKVHKLEKINLSTEDKKLVSLIRSQLVLDWRTPILSELNDLIKKYPVDDKANGYE